MPVGRYRGWTLDELPDDAYRLAADPTCPALRIGGSIRFPRARFLRWLQTQEQGRGRHHRGEASTT